jgi:two-component system cell cycle response regulator
MMSRMLAQFPDQRFATSCTTALRLARESPPDLILLDAEMPGMTGFQLQEELQSDPALAGVPIIFASSHGGMAMKASALYHGAAGYFTKPLDAARLTARVQAQLRQRP